MSTRTTAVPDAARQHYQALVMPHLEALLAFALRRTPAPSDAAAAVEETCVRARLAFAEHGDDARVRPWLYRILCGVLREARERGGWRPRLVAITRLEDEHATIIDAAEESQFVETLARLTCEAVRAALDSIPEEFADAVELHDVEHLAYESVAEVLEISIGTVMRRIARGRRLLAGAVIANQRTWTERSRRADRGTAR